MNICAHITKDSFWEFHENYNLNCFQTLSPLLPEHQFILLTDSKEQIISSGPNCKVVLLPKVNNRLQKYLLGRYQIPAILKKNKATVFIPAANSFFNLSNVIQLPVIQNIEFLPTKKKKWKNKKLSAIISTVPAEEELKNPDYTLVRVNHGMHADFKPLNENDKNEVRKKYTLDHEYFYTDISSKGETQLKLILKAFSIFKKWQHSSLKLVVLLPQSVSDNPLPDFNLYKYRNDVVLIHDSKINQKERAAIQGTAYACIHNDHLRIIASIKCHVPSIVTEAYKDAYGEAVFYSSTDEKSIARGMIDIYKNELLRNSLVMAASLLSAEYTWENAAIQLWKVIQNSIQ